MTEATPNQEPHELLFAPSLAAQYLAAELGDTAELWLYRMQNWRRPDRKPTRRPVPEFITNESGHPVYSSDALYAFIERERAPRALMATGIDQARAAAAPQLDGTDKPHVRLSVAVGQVSQAVFALDAATAKQLAAMLTKAAAAVEHVTVECIPKKRVSSRTKATTEGATA